jgi:hypothetical protein
VELAILLGVATVLLFMGSMMLLSSLGVIAADDLDGWFARGMVFVFGAVILWAGGALLLKPLLLMAKHQGAPGLPGALLLGARRLAARVEARSLGAAALLAPLVWEYRGALLERPTWLWSQAALIDLVVIEFLLIHGFPFLVVAGRFGTAPERGPRWAGRAGVALLTLLYGAFAWGAGGPWGVADLLYLAVPNVLAFVRPRDGARAMMPVATRWLVKFVSFFMVAVLLDQRTLRGEGNLEIGLVYFGVLLVVELFRVAEIPLDLGAAWRRVPQQERRTVALQWSEGS